MTKKLKEIRRAVADYIDSDGCECCRDGRLNYDSKERLAKLLNVPECEDEYQDNFDFALFKTPKNPKKPKKSKRK